MHRTAEQEAMMVGPGHDPAVDALLELGEQLDRTVAQLAVARARVAELAALRAEGVPWRTVVENEDRPLVVETVTTALDDLGNVGGRFRREEARALQREAVSMTRIATLFGVTRQRVSVLLQEPGVATGRKPVQAVPEDEVG